MKSYKLPHSNEKCRCPWQCSECYLTMINYKGCKCSGCNPAYRRITASTKGPQSPIEFARTIGILYRTQRICYVGNRFYDHPTGSLTEAVY